MSRLIPIELGTRVGRLIVVKRIENCCGAAQFLCLCDCGKETKKSSYRIRHGLPPFSCGCETMRLGRTPGSSKKKNNSAIDKFLYTHPPAVRKTS